MTSDPGKLSRAHAADAATVLAEAFVSDPLWRLLFEAAEERRAVLGRFFQAVVRTAIDRGEAHGAGVPLDCVAVWRGPGERRPVSPSTLAWWLPLAGSSFPMKALSVRRVFSEFAEMHARHASGPHYFLETIGTRPDRQGSGTASALIKPFLLLADEQGVPAYTETVTEENVPLYEHLGFVMVESRLVRACNLEAFGLLRRPRERVCRLLTTSTTSPNRRPGE